jgi:MATE family multidrug resistance protein
MTELKITIANFRREIAATLTLALPLLIAQLAQMGTGVVDTIMAGRYAAEDLAAIAIGYNFWLPIYLVSLGIMLAVTSIVAQHFGAGRIEQLRRCLPQAIWLALALGLLSMPLLLFPGPVLELLDLDSATQQKSSQYLWACAWGMPGAALFQALRCHTQGVGIVRPFAIASVIGFCANVPLNYAFIYGRWGVPEMGAAGCGWATAISMWLAPALIGIYVARSGPLRQYLPALRMHWPQWIQMREILVLGVPIGLTFFFEVAVFSVIAFMIATLGNTAIAAHQIGFNIYDVVYVPLISVGAAMTTRMGHAIGAGSMPAVSRSLYSGMLLSLGVVLLVTPFLAWLPDLVARAYTEDTAIRSAAVSLLQLTSLFVIFDMLAVTTSAALRAFKDTVFPFVVMAIAYWCVALPLGYWLGLADSQSSTYGPRGFWIAMIVGIAIAAALSGWRLRRWMRQPLSVMHTPDSADRAAD